MIKNEQIIFQFMIVFIFKLTMSTQGSHIFNIQLLIVQKQLKKRNKNYFVKSLLRWVGSVYSRYLLWRSCFYRFSYGFVSAYQLTILHSLIQNEGCKISHFLSNLNKFLKWIYTFVQSIYFYVRLNKIFKIPPLNFMQIQRDYNSWIAGYLFLLSE